MNQPIEQLTERIEIAEEAARIGGRILNDWAGRFTAREKSRFNLVTEADLESQRAIHAEIVSRFADDAFLGEEGLQESGSGSAFRWIIDPLDGTSNYVHQFPYYCVSIGLEHAGELVGGVIYDPTRNDLFSARKDSGTTLNGETLSVSEATELTEGMFLGSLPINPDPADPAVQRFLGALPRVQTVQRTGSAALNLAYLAAGRIEGFWSSSLKPWDMAAGVVIAREAGGTVTKIDGTPFDVNQPDLLATCGGPLHTATVDLLAEVITPASDI